MDRTAIETLGVPGIELMERAGAGAFGVLRARWPGARRLCIVAGTGNNGGDGYVLARRAREAGLEVSVAQLGEPARIAGDAARARDRLMSAGTVPAPFDALALADADVVVDAVFGTGLGREVRGAWRGALEAVNAAAKPVLALDVPSGLDADSGAVHGIAVEASATVTFVALKQGLLTGEGPASTGALCLDDLGVGGEVAARTEPSAWRMVLEDHAPLLAPRPRSAHKGRYGHVLVVGGEHGFAGAARMAGEAAARAGAGLVSVATRAAHAAGIASARPELMVHGVEEAAALASLLERASVIALGPGLGQSPWSQALWEAALAAGKPLVVDADGLNLLARAATAGRASRRADWVLTPHPGEAGRLLGSQAGAVQRDRFAAVADLAERYGGVAVLKGSGTLVLASGERAPRLCDAGNPGMATGGMGDVLTGVVAGLMAQGLAPGDAARLGVCLHAHAADRAAAEQGERGLLALDLMAHLRRLVNPFQAHA